VPFPAQGAALAEATPINNTKTKPVRTIAENWRIFIFLPPFTPFKSLFNEMTQFSLC
jgi:hypothetical protein